MMENEAEFDKWLSSELGKLSLDDESVVEYVGSIVKVGSQFHHTASRSMSSPP